MNPDTFLKEALGSAEPGRHYGGGRRLAGGFEIPIGFLAGSYDEEYMRSKWRLIDHGSKPWLWLPRKAGRLVESFGIGIGVGIAIGIGIFLFRSR